jgi:hypothetical protein
MEDTDMTTAERALEFIRSQHSAGRNVIVSTHLKHTRYSPKHSTMFKLSGKGDLLVARGKNWDCLATPTHCLVKLIAE